MAYRGYGQYCPLALAAELLCERWTLLIVSRLLGGCRRFNEIHRGVPKISATLLTQRLGALERAGLVYRVPLESGRGFEYRLTQAGEELEPVIAGLAVWGQHWSRDMVTEDLDPAFLVWDMHLRMNAEQMPEQRTVIEFDFSGTHADLRRFWLVSENGSVDMCLKYPGYESDLVVRSDIRAFVECWRGIRDLRAEIARGRIALEGPKNLRKAFPGWLRRHVLADVPRRADGQERDRSEPDAAAAL